MLQTEYYQWQLYHLHADVTDKEEEVEGLGGEMDGLRKAEEEGQGKLKEVKKKASATRRAAGNAEKARVKVRQQ